MKIDFGQKKNKKKKPEAPKMPIDKKRLFIIISVIIGVIVIAAVSGSLIYINTAVKEGKKNFGGVYMNDASFKYDGTPKTIHVVGAPSDADIEYSYDFKNESKGLEGSGSGNSFVESGVYNVTAKLSKKGYNDRTLTAKVTIIRNYSITFRQTGYSDIVFTIDEGKTFGKASIPTPKAQKGYTVRWADVSLNNVTQDIVVECKRYLYTYSVEYWERGGLYDGENYNPTTYSVESLTTILKEPYRNDAVFMGWFDQNDNKVEKLPGDSAANLILKAKWLSSTELDDDIKLNYDASLGGYLLTSYVAEEHFEYVEPEAPPRVDPVGPNEQIPDSDPSLIASNEDPTETDGTEVNSSQVAVTGEGKKVEVGDDDKVDVGGEKEPQTTEVVDKETGEKVEKTLEEIDAEKYKPQTTDEKYLVIPDMYENKPVVEIDDKTFSEREIYYAYIGKKVKRIGNECFMKCRYLKNVYGLDSVLEVGDSAFGSTDLSAISLESATKLGDKAFAFCNSMTSIKLGDGLKTIGANCFESCFTLSEIYISKSVVYIGENAFKGCRKLAIHYQGSQSEWNALIESLGGAEKLGLSGRTVYFNSIKSDLDIISLN